MTTSQFAAFEEFVENDLGNGSGRFQMPTIDADGDLTPRTVQIQVTSGQKPYSAGWTGAYWRVSFSLMVYP